MAVPEPNLFTPSLRKVDIVFLHCSASDNPAHADISVIRKWHTSPDPRDASKPWSDVGYHYFVTFDGVVQKGRDIEAAPAAQAGHNAHSIAICLAGGQHGTKAFTAAQYTALKKLCMDMLQEMPWLTFHGHCEVSKKACPVFDYKAVLDLDAEGRIIQPK